MKDKHSRRRFLRQSLWSSAFLAGGALLGTACGGGESGAGGSSGKDEENGSGAQKSSMDPCDPAILSEEDLQARKSLGYEERSPIPDQQCSNCNLFLPPAGDNKCGGCTLFKGPVPPAAYCTYWAPQV